MFIGILAAIITAIITAILAYILTQYAAAVFASYNKANLLLFSGIFNNAALWYVAKAVFAICNPYKP